MSDVQLPKLQVLRDFVSVTTAAQRKSAGAGSTDPQDSVSLSHGQGEGYRAPSVRQMREALNMVMHGRAPAEPTKEERLATLTRMVQADYAQYLQGR